MWRIVKCSQCGQEVPEDECPTYQLKHLDDGYIEPLAICDKCYREMIRPKKFWEPGSVFQTRVPTEDLQSAYIDRVSANKLADS